MVKLQAKYEQLLQHNSSAILMFRPLLEVDLNDILLSVDMTSQFRLPATLTSLKIAVGGLNSKDAHSSKAGLHLTHQYLCESPHHVHLKIIQAAIIFELLDLYNRAQYEDLNLRGNRK
ncbi:hypothetical protein KI688_000951 [Linnemannia hyalina]|uniref:Uncharacterized protein n=1 Tax=Linnemannia hyalina TaxID=64524 RepID=A0A9P8BXZ4_9FUNG|nr:hypothetical protein KI688_000951 [Linnemannia hyalina]